MVHVGQDISRLAFCEVFAVALTVTTRVAVRVFREGDGLHRIESVATAEQDQYCCIPATLVTLRVSTYAAPALKHGSDRFAKTRTNGESRLADTEKKDICTGPHWRTSGLLGWSLTQLATRK